MLRKIGLFSCRALEKASSPQACQSTGLCACWSRYGDFSRASRFVCACVRGAAFVVTMSLGFDDFGWQALNASVTPSAMGFAKARFILPELNLPQPPLQRKGGGKKLNAFGNYE